MLPDDLPTAIALADAALHESASSKGGTVYDLLLLCVAELGIVSSELGQSGAAQAWLQLAEAHIGLPRTDEARVVTYCRRVVSAALGDMYRDRGEDDTALWPDATANQVAPDPRVEGTTAVLAHAMQRARRMVMAGEQDAAIRLLQAALVDLDYRESKAADAAQMAQAVLDELSADSPQEARRAALRQVALLAAMRVPPHARVVHLMFAVGHARRAGRRDLALRDAREALRMCAEPGGEEITWSVFGALAEAEAEFGRPVSAILLDKLAIAELCLLRRKLADFDPALTTLEGPGRGLLDRLVERLVASGRLLEAEEAAPLALAHGVARVPPPSLVPAEAEAVSLLVKACSTDDGPSLRYTLDVLEQVACSVPGGARPVGTWQQTAQPSGQDLLRLSYVAEGGQLVCLAHRGEDARRLDLDLSLHEANRLAFELRRAVLERRSDPVHLLQKGYDLLLRTPLAALGEEVRRARVAAPGSLRLLPWSALHDGAAYAVERCAWIRAVAGVDLDRPPLADVSLLACVATRDGAGFPALGETAAREAEAIASIWRGGHVLVDDEFTWQSLGAALPVASVLHVASHFEADAGRIGRSRLLLGDGTVAPLAELARLDLCGLDLVVLSACSTAVAAAGKEAEESASAVDAMLLAGGARATVGTLWSVDSDAMADMMAAFHGHLRAGLHKDEALACAQRALLTGQLGDHRWKLPFFWAAPVLSGNWLGWLASATPRQE